MSPLDRRRFIFTVGAAAVIMGDNPASAQESVTINGFWWEEQNALAKYGYVVGYVDASTQAFSVLPAIQQESKIQQTTELQGLWKTNFDYSNIAFGQFVEGVDKFYEDFRNKRISVRDAMNYVKEEVQGIDPAKLETTLLTLRKWATKDK